MKTMDMALAELYKKELISYDNAIAYSMDREMIKK